MAVTNNQLCCPKMSSNARLVWTKIGKTVFQYASHSAHNHIEMARFPFFVCTFRGTNERWNKRHTMKRAIFRLVPSAFFGELFQNAKFILHVRLVRINFLYTKTICAFCIFESCSQKSKTWKAPFQHRIRQYMYKQIQYRYIYFFSL